MHMLMMGDMHAHVGLFNIHMNLNKGKKVREGCITFRNLRQQALKNWALACKINIIILFV